MAPPPPFVRLNIGFTLEQHEWLRDLAFVRRTSIAALIRQLVEERRITIDPQERLPLRIP
jgi:hypothetical protein